MGRKKEKGLYQKGEIWHIDKRVLGRRLRGSTGTGDEEEARRYLERRVTELRRSIQIGERQRRRWKEAAARHLREGIHRSRIADDALHIRKLEPYLGDLWLDEVDDDALAPFVAAQLEAGRKKRTVNAALEVVRSIVNKAATSWRENRLTWLVSAPAVTMLEVDDARPAYPISWDEQARLLAPMPPHLERMTLFALNTGCREQEICQLRTAWLGELGGVRYVVIPKEYTKGKKRAKLVALNRAAAAAVGEPAGEFVFTYAGRPVRKMNNTAWRRARRIAGVPAREHDLRHTFSARLLDLGVSEEMRARLLGHAVGSVTQHYSLPALQTLYAAVELLCGPRVPMLRVAV